MNDDWPNDDFRNLSSMLHAKGANDLTMLAQMAKMMRKDIDRFIMEEPTDCRTAMLGLLAHAVAVLCERLDNLERLSN